MSTARSPTVGGVSNPWPLVRSSLGTGISSEMGAEIGGPGGDDVYASVVTVVVSMSTTGTPLSSEILNSTRLLQ